MSVSIGKSRLKLTTNLTPVKIGRPGAITGANPSLSLNFLSGSLERRIDFTRTSGGGYFGPDGLFRFTPASRNLLLQTQEFDVSTWSKAATAAYPFDPALATYGPELVTNGDFASGTTAWSGNANATLSVVSGALRVTAVANGTAYASQGITTVPGRGYFITMNYVTDAITGNAFLYAGPSAGSGSIANLTIGSTLGAHSLYFVATGTTTFISVSTSTGVLAGEYCDFDNISVREVIGGLLAPDGTLTADAVLPTATTAAHNVQQSGGGSGTPLTLSVYAKAGSHAFMQLSHGSLSAIYANFNLLTGTVGTVGASATATITPAGDGWYRCAMTFTPGGAANLAIGHITSATAVYRESWAATGTESIYLWGAQLELASAATDYTRNNGGRYPPRFDYDPVTLAPRGLLVEEQRTNLLLRSEEFENAAWTKSNTTVTANAGMSPDGTADADLLVENTATAIHQVRSSGATYTTGNAYTISVYAKNANGSRFLNIYPSLSVSGNGFGSFNLIAGTAATTAGTGSASASITDVGNGWYRCSVSFVAQTTITPSTAAYFSLSDVISQSEDSYTGDGTSGIYLWGAQLELGSFPTSYIPTAASQVTRAADNAVITGANFSRWYNQSEGTFVAEADSFSPVDIAVRFAVAAGNAAATSRNTVFLYNGKWGSSSRISGVDQCDLQQAGSYTANATAKIAFAYKANDFAASVNGAAPLTDTSGSLPSVDRLFISGADSTNTLNGHIRRIRYYPTRLSNAQLQTLTA